MSLQTIRWKEWDAVLLQSQECELVVGVSSGPRILSLKHNDGPNLLYEDQTGFRVGEWRLHGGHRFTVAPEAARSYTPDNAPCTFQTQDLQLRVSAPVANDGTVKILEISPGQDGVGFDLRHILVNRGEKPWTGALWAITCIPNLGTILAPRTSSHFHLWPGADSKPWSLDLKEVRLQRARNRTKAGWYSEAAWLASIQPTDTFVIHSPEPPPNHACVDNGCNIEVFGCEHYMELETLSGNVTLQPGESETHLQRWRLLPTTTQFPEIQSIDLQTRPQFSTPPITHAH